MDIISHALIGRILALQPKNSKKQILLIIFFSLLADILSLLLYFYVGYLNKRLFWMPKNSDWQGIRVLHPYWTAIGDIPHSLIFLILIIIPLVIFLKLPKINIWAYFIHILFDIPTHTGEWAIRIFYPLNYKIEGFTDAWAWPVSKILISWFILFGLIITLSFIFKKFGFFSKKLL